MYVLNAVYNFILSIFHQHITFQMSSYMSISTRQLKCKKFSHLLISTGIAVSENARISISNRRNMKNRNQRRNMQNVISEDMLEGVECTIR